MKHMHLLMSLFTLPATMALADLPDPTFFKFEGSPSGYVARGEKKIFRPYNSEIFANPWGPEGITVFARSIDGKDWWHLQIRAPRGRTLQTKSYTDTLRAGNDGSQPWLSFGGNGRECNQASGEFHILELVYDAQGKPKRLAVDFYLKTGEENSKNQVKGTVRFNSSIPETEVRPALIPSKK